MPFTHIHVDTIAADTITIKHGWTITFSERDIRPSDCVRLKGKPGALFVDDDPAMRTRCGTWVAQDQ